MLWLIIDVTKLDDIWKLCNSILNIIYGFYHNIIFIGFGQKTEDWDEVINYIQWRSKMVFLINVIIRNIIMIFFYFMTDLRILSINNKRLCLN